jgi:hypothetical protein
MSDVSKSHETSEAGEAPGRQKARLSKQRSLSDYEQRVKRARLELVQAKKRLQLQSARDCSRRERATGKIVLVMIEQGRLDSRTLALIRDEVRASCRSPALVAAFRGSVLD